MNKRLPHHRSPVQRAAAPHVDLAGDAPKAKDMPTAGHPCGPPHWRRGAYGTGGLWLQLLIVRSRDVLLGPIVGQVGPCKVVPPHRGYIVRREEPKVPIVIRTATNPAGLPHVVPDVALAAHAMKSASLAFTSFNNLLVAFPDRIRRNVGAVELRGWLGHKENLHPTCGQRGLAVSAQ